MLQHYPSVVVLEQVPSHQLAALVPLPGSSQECLLLCLRWWLQVQTVSVCVQERISLDPCARVC